MARNSQYDKDYGSLTSDSITVRNTLTANNQTLSGDLEVTGDVAVTGLITGEHRPAQQELTESGAITITNGYVLLNHATVIIAATLPAPTVGDRLTIVDTSLTGTAAHTVTTAEGVTFDGTNNTATFNLLAERLELLAVSATRWVILENVGSVGLSDV